MRSKFYQSSDEQTITIIGIGSLLLKEWAQKTCPNLTNFRLASIKNYKRVFNKTDSFIVRNGLLPKESKAYACLSAVPSSDTHNMIVSVFEIPLSEWAAFVQREFEYKLVNTPFIEQKTGKSGHGVLCMGNYQNDAECETIINADPLRSERWAQFRAKYKGPMWRYDLLPEPEYLNACLKAAQGLGNNVYENFITTSFIGDGRSIKTYLKDIS